MGAGLAYCNTLGKVLSFSALYFPISEVGGSLGPDELGGSLGKGNQGAEWPRGSTGGRPAWGSLPHLCHLPARQLGRKCSMLGTQ